MKTKNCAMERILALLTAVMLLCTLFGCAAAEEEPTDEGGVPGLTPHLPQKVTEYDLDYETKTWQPVRSWTYTYENGYPVLVDCHEIDLDVHVVSAYQYEFENGIPVKRTFTDETYGRVTTVEYVKGKPYNITTLSNDGVYTSRDYFQYAGGDDYFTLVLHEHHSVYPDEPDMNDDAEEVDAVSVTSANGLLVRTINTGMYANWIPSTEKEWLRFNGTYSATYDSDGIVVSTSVVYRTGNSGVDGRFDAYRENGLITEATVLNPDGTSWSGMTRFVFEYTDTEISAARYAIMINSFLLGEENNYYKFFWY